LAQSFERPADFLSVDSVYSVDSANEDHQRILLNVHLQPGARSTALAGRHGDALKIRIAAPAVDNKANAALITFLSALLGIAAHRIHIRSGRHSRRKRVEIAGASSAVAARLRAAIATAG
jgi:uncharacterized protein